ncbi:MAG: alpha-D-ribose 1-methylphosphonate 5-triphosphate diphosphatase [Devosia sp.]|uniref:alpha-D-ribose 1-methylphosphonate 5-triphosphate diphosphatase n=1 Tax=Devosia sp. TaxID=1871048 RepID=UPI002632BCFF|nr:alpha-D-ribose 1-methylphosphonate 5-triphosphate diphosphatase [Devosia sp.]MDB5528137.1 alpha-D-ribose 1-methylphosphonate 5-triphosphate diphosphatase [Devosia sp.]
MWLSDFRIVLADRLIPHGALRIEDGLIAEISETPVAEADIVGNGLILLPGMIDMHGDMIEREIEPRPGVRMPMEMGLRDLDRKLANSGITTAYAAVSFSPGSTYGHMRSYDFTSEMIRAIRAHKANLLIDHRVHARFEVTFPAALSVVKELIAEGSVDLISLCDHTPGQGQYRDMPLQAANLAKSKGITLEQAQANLEQRIRDRKETAGDLTATLRTMAQYCALHGVPLASHDDDTVEKVAQMQELGASISEFPVTLDAAREAKARGMVNAMGAPNALRGTSYSGNLSAREAHAAGLLDLLAADYHPSAMLPAVLVLAQTDPDGLPGAARLATRNPARALGLEDRGEIAVGLRADLIVADSSGVGHIRATFCNGVMVYSDGSVAPGNPVRHHDVIRMS